MSRPGDPGLCADCRHAKLLRTKSGFPIVLCRLAETDRSFAKYPRLPMRVCPGHRPGA